MRHHSFDEWLREFADSWRSRAKFPEFIDLLRRFATLEVAPEVILNCRFSRASSFAHKNYGTLVAYEFEWSPRRESLRARGSPLPSPGRGGGSFSRGVTAVSEPRTLVLSPCQGERREKLHEAHRERIAFCHCNGSSFALILPK